ncbi:MAG: methyltransferase domain-containing protein [Candidatus Margulisbacteria bacterium]|nr:methyltransferase domain-containing protein [Candidatus Margulisiibacteriota bacterium]
MTHKFKSENISRLDNPERRVILPPKKLLQELGLKSNDRMLDVGAGIGYFSFPAAEIVGESGKVTAVDTSPEMIKELQARISNASTNNIETIISKEYSFGVSENYFDFVLISLVLHEIEGKLRFIKAAHAALKKSGTLAIIEWIRQPTVEDRNRHDRISKTDAMLIIPQAGFTKITDYDYNNFFYYITAKKMTRYL